MKKKNSNTTNGKMIRISKDVWDWFRDVLTWGQTPNDYLTMMMNKDKEKKERYETNRAK